ncbi:hypothetical protein WJU23_09410 [Prosthecobacter sp. SYSU 5D2]|uniref:McrB family protein n=1 Tax=Prosthecobacter sp. SYSU 5D2 TaxID=3134134 RepID=UPI0031FEA3C2
MARLTKERSLEPVITAAQEWVRNCLIADNSVFSKRSLWTPENVEEVRRAFVGNLDRGKDDFSTKLKGQMAPTSPPAKQLMAEMMWALLLFPSNIKTSTKRQQIGEMWSMSGESLSESQLLLSDNVLAGIGSGGTGFNNHRWREMVFLISLVGDLKARTMAEREKLMLDYDVFLDWIAQVPQEGYRQFRHMLRFFCFPDRVERMCSNGERWAVLAGFGVAPEKQTKNWGDRQLDDALLTLRQKLEGENPGEILDFYEDPLREKWKFQGDSQTRLLAVFVGQASQTNLNHGLGNGIWGFKDSAKPEDLEQLKAGDIIILGSGYSGGSPRTTFEVWKQQKLSQVKYARIIGRPYQSGEVEWPDEQSLDERDRYLWRIKFDPKSVRTLSNIALNDETILTPELSESLRKSGSANGRGYVLSASNFIIIEDEDVSAPEEPSLPRPPILAFDAAAFSEAVIAIGATNFRVEEGFLGRFIASLAAKPFLILTGNSGTGKTKLTELFVQWLSGNRSGQFAIVPVGADWTDNRNVLGFVNHLRTTILKEAGTDIPVPVYQTTKILDLLLDAGRKENEGKPFFLILDEMNLSHVERYFADFLSTMESKEGRLLLHGEGRLLPRRQGGQCDVPESLALPRNVFVIGTVNVDETTYMFSPKVLDRANVIEFRVEAGVPVRFLESGGRGIGSIVPASAGYDAGFLELSLRARSEKGLALALVAHPDRPPADAKEGIEKCHTTITDLFFLMQRRHLEFAFRTIAEILRFLAVNYELKPADVAWNWRSAMDAQILQKVLPKLHGSKRKIGSLLAALAKYCEHGILTDADALMIDETKAEAYLAAEDRREKSPAFMGSYSKLCEMMEAVRRDQFVSFIQ